MSKKRKKPFLQRTAGKLLFTFVIIVIAAAFVLILIPPGTSRDHDAEKAERQDVQSSVRIMMDEAVPPVENLETDERIAGFVNIQAEATDYMADGGLIDIVDAYISSGSITALAQILEADRTLYKYWLEADGTLHQVVP